MPCYFVARIEVKDQEAYQRYLEGTGPVLEQFGGTVLAVDEDVTVLEGEWPATRTVLVRGRDVVGSTEQADAGRVAR